MKVYLSIIFFIFSFQSWTKAEDIRDFEIEGMSIGDSLLNHFNERTIINNINNSIRGKFYISSIRDTKFKDYDSIDFYLKSNDKKYEIHAINAMIYYDNQIDKCKIKKKEVLNNLENILKIKFLTFEGKHNLDNESKTYQSFYRFSNDANIRVECYSWINNTKKKYNFVDNLSISLVSKKIQKWISDGYE